MKKLALAVFASASLLAACGDGTDQSSSLNAAIPSTVLSFNGFSNRCTNNNFAPALKYWGQDAASRVQYTIENIRFAPVYNGSCDVNVGIKIAPGYRARLKGVYGQGKYIGVNNPNGRLDLYVSLAGGKVYKSIFNKNGTQSYTINDYVPNPWTTCSSSPSGTPFIVLVRPQVVLANATSTPKPSLSVDLNASVYALEVEKCK